MVSIIESTIPQNLVRLNGNEYKINGGVQTRPANEFSPKITLGSDTYASRENVSQLVLDSWTGGLGVKSGKTAEILGRFYISSGADTRFSNQLTLGPLVNTAGSGITTGQAVNSLNAASYAEFLGVEYFAIEDKVYSWDGASLTQVFDSGGAVNHPVFLGVFTTSAGTPRLFLMQWNGEIAYTENGTAWTTAGGAIGNSFVEYDSHMILIGGTDQRAQIDYSDTPDGAIGSYATLISLGGAAATRFPSQGIVFRDSSGEFVPYILVKEGGSGPADTSARDRLYVLDYYARTLRRTNVGPIRANLSPHRMAIWNNSLYFTDGASLMKFDVDNYQDVSPATDQGMPPGYGGFQALAAARQNLYFLANNRAADMAGSTIAVGSYTGVGLHFLVTQTTPIWGIWQSEVAANRLYWVEGANSGTSFTVKYIKESTVGGNPVNDSTYPYAASGYVITPWYDLWLADLSKTLLKGRVFGRGLTATETATIEYQIAPNTDTDSGPWLTLGTFDTDGEEVSFGSGSGVVTEQVRFKITLARGVTTTATPIVTAIVIDFDVQTEFRSLKQFDISIADTVAHRYPGQTDPVSIAQVKAIIDEIKTAFAPGTLRDFQHGDDTVIKVRVQDFPHRVWDTPEGGRDGIITVALLEPIAA